jgi:hypothetical protein
MFDSTDQWWTLLRSVSAFNLLAWGAAALWLWRGRRQREYEAHWPLIRAQLALSAIYVLGCAYRSLLPVYDVQRLVLVDSWWSSVIVGRTVASIAELCFAAQWALLLRRAARDAGSRFAEEASRRVLPLILAAEVCSWHAVLTTANLGHVIEEVLWGTTALLLLASLVALAPRVDVRQRAGLAFWGVAAAAYAAYMFAVDVPMYWARWVADEAQARDYLSLGHGVLDAATRWTVSHDWAHWRSEWPWMTAYFSVAVWLSIALTQWPQLNRRAAETPTMLRRR